MTDLEEARERCRDEVVAQHVFLADWLSGAVDDRAAFDGFAAAHDPGFVMYGTDGAARGRAEVLSMLEGACGTVPGLRIGIRDVRVTVASGALIVGSYEEVHEAAGSPAGSRRVTVVLRREAGAPRGLSWCHLQETWISPPPG